MEAVEPPISPTLSNPNKLSLFKFDKNEVRIVMKNNIPWFVAKDIGNALGILNSRDTYTRLDDDQRDAVLIDTPGGSQKMIIVNESGLYTIILSGRKEEAKKFRRWITADVLPSIRKYGVYATDDTIAKIQRDPALIAQMIEDKKQSDNRLILLESENKKNRLLPFMIMSKNLIKLDTTYDEFYIIGNRTGMKTMEYSFGKAKNSKTRLISHNKAHHEKLFIIMKFKCFNAYTVENRLFF